jgi:hypothetical protein
MSAAAKLAGFAAALALLFGGAALAGAAIGPDAGRDVASTHSPLHADMSSNTKTAPTHGGHGESAAAHSVRGLAIAEDGLRVVVQNPELQRGRDETLRFRIVDEHDWTVRDFDVEHEKRMHLILARRDLTGFQHLHPEQTEDGTWSTRVRLDAAGSYRLFADFSHDGEAHTLASDLRVDGTADLRPLPAPAPTAVSDGGYDVRLDSGSVRPGQEATLRFTITRDGVAVRTEPYLGAGGHLVALREGDMAFLHVHPTAEDSVQFAATFPTAGRYRLFLQFEHEGRVQTVAFTQEVK